MARIYHTAKSRKERYCTPGHHTIPVGSAVASAAPGFRSREIFACAAHPFRPSNLTTSLRAEPLAAQEALEDAMGAMDQEDPGVLDELTAALEEFQSAVEEYASTRREALDAWENGNSQLEELSDTAENAESEATGVEVEEWDGDEELRDSEPDEEPDDEDSPEWTAWDEKRQAIEDEQQSWHDHVEAQFDAVSEMLAGIEF